MRRVGLFGGTFDPIHNGHLNLAIEIFQANNLDEILFCPAQRSPHKMDSAPIAPSEQRKEMVRLAIEDVPAFSLLDLELNRKGPSFTIDTIRELIATNPDTQFHLIWGKDVFNHLESWKEIDDLLKLAPPLVGERKNAEIECPPRFQKILESGVVSIPVFDIDSTELRKRLKNKKYCGHLIPGKVLDYILAQNIY